MRFALSRSHAVPMPSGVMVNRSFRLAAATICVQCAPPPRSAFGPGVHRHTPSREGGLASYARRRLATAPGTPVHRVSGLYRGPSPLVCLDGDVKPAPHVGGVKRAAARGLGASTVTRISRSRLASRRGSPWAASVARPGGWVQVAPKVVSASWFVIQRRTVTKTASISAASSMRDPA